MGSDSIDFHNQPMGSDWIDSYEFENAQQLLHKSKPMGSDWIDSYKSMGSDSIDFHKPMGSDWID